MSRNTKRIGLALLIGALASLILLATSLSNLQLHAGTPFPGVDNSNDTIQSVRALPLVQTYSIPILRGIFALILLVLMIYVPARFITLLNLKKIFQVAFAIVVLIIIISIISRISPVQPAYPSITDSAMPSPLPFNYPVSPLGNAPQEVIWLVLIGVLFGGGLLFIRILKRGMYPARTDDEILREAELAVNALQAGSELRNVIIRCYLQMTRTLQEERGLERSYNMTVEEFQDWLEAKGFPTGPIHQLTGLFEKVRYGKQQMSTGDEAIALASLNEIIQYSRSTRD